LLKDFTPLTKVDQTTTLVRGVTCWITGCGMDRKSTSGTCHFLRSSLVCWSAHKQSFVAQSTTKAEYVVAASYCSQILWIVHTMRDYRMTYKSVPLMCDSFSAIYLAQN
jgi:hypothetical protein